MMAIEQRVETRESITPKIFEDEILNLGRPVVLKGLVANWPVVRAAKQSHEALGEYLKQHDGGVPIETFVGQPEMEGRYFYNDDLTGFNFEKGKTGLSHIVDQLLLTVGGPPPLMIYAGSAPASEAMPAFSVDNPLPLLDPDVEPRLWLGNRSRVAAHYDASRNVACCVSGKRRFIIFPPEQVGNLYLGPLEFTMAGPPASMVDFSAPDYSRFPNFRQAGEAALVADLDPGDAIYIPALWLHHVEAFGDFNLLVNYWWFADDAGPSLEAMLLTMLAIRDLPQPEKQAWRTYFEHFAFGPQASQVSSHLPSHCQTVTGMKSASRDARIMDFLRKRLFD